MTASVGHWPDGMSVPERARHGRAAYAPFLATSAGGRAQLLSSPSGQRASLDLGVGALAALNGASPPDRGYGGYAS